MVALNLGTRGSGRKLATVDMSSPQSSITVVLLNLTTKHGSFASADRQNYNHSTNDLIQQLI